MPDESLPATLGQTFGDCFDTYVGGECLPPGEAFVRHPFLMAWRVLTYEPLLTLLAAAALIGAVVAYRRWMKKKAAKEQTHDTPSA